MAKILGERETRIQIFASVFQNFIFGWTYGLCPILYICLLLFVPYVRWLMVAYTAWMVYDRNTPKRGGRPWLWLRRLSIWKDFIEFFPIRVHKTADLDAERRYIFGCHPHGMEAIGVVGTFGMECTSFYQDFPGIKPYLATLASNFWIPFRREIFLWLGIIDVCKESVEYLLSEGPKGTAVTIVIGGADESLDAQPGSNKLALKERKGFVKVAMRHGASLVPVFSFGENELFDQNVNEEGTKPRELQEKLKDIIGFSPAIFWGRGITSQRTPGLLPYRRPINVVVGKAINVEKCVEPTQEQIDDLHEQYMRSLQDLYNSNKARFGISAPLELKD